MVWQLLMSGAVIYMGTVFMHIVEMVGKIATVDEGGNATQKQRTKHKLMRHAMRVG